MIAYADVISYLRRQQRRKDRPRCGAKTRAGRPCRMRVEFGKARCRLHGGLSTGPKTEAGRARIAEAQRRRWRDYRERRLVFDDLAPLKRAKQFAATVAMLRTIEWEGVASVA
jgi:hypothetical protein